MLAVPAATPVAVPTLFTVATAVASEAHVTSEEITWVLESLNIPVAVNPNLLPGAIVREDGVTDIDAIVALLTFRLVEAIVDPRVAVIKVVPVATAFAVPLPAPIVATPVFDELQTTCPVRFLVPPSLNVPTALNF